jgi:hypothetical protein
MTSNRSLRRKVSGNVQGDCPRISVQQSSRSVEKLWMRETKSRETAKQNHLFVLTLSGAARTMLVRFDSPKNLSTVPSPKVAQAFGVSFVSTLS